MMKREYGWASIALVGLFLLPACDDVDLTSEGIGPDVQVCVIDCVGDQSISECSKGLRICNQDVAPNNLRLSFGEAEIEKGVRREAYISNQGDKPLLAQVPTFSSGAYFNFSIDPNGSDFPLQLEPQQEATIFFSYKPMTGGENVAIVQIASNDEDEPQVWIDLNGKTLAPKVCIEPAEIDFGNITMGKQSDPKSFTVKNCGLANLNLEKVTLSGDSSADFTLPNLRKFPVTLEPEDSVTIDVVYSPLDKGPDFGDVEIFSDDPLSDPVTHKTGQVPLYGASVPTACDLVVSPNPVRFGGVMKGEAVKANLQIVNQGTDNCTVHNVTIKQNSKEEEFTLLDKPAAETELKPGDPPLLAQLQYQPINLGADSGILSVTGNDITTEEIQVGLVGEGVATAICDLQIEPLKYDFGTVKVNNTYPLAVKLSNYGYKDCHVSSIDLKQSQIAPGDYSITTKPKLPLTLKPRGTAGAEDQAVVTLAPDNPGEHKSYLWITSDDPDLKVGSIWDGCIPKPVNGQACIVLDGQAEEAAIAAVPSELDFGVVTIGCKSPEMVVTIYNLGGIELTIKNVSLDNSPDAQYFEIRSAPMPNTPLAGGASLEVKLRFVPPDPGIHLANLVVESDATNEPQMLIPLRGEGTNIENQIDAFNQPSRVKSDVLFVVDNSGSMEDEQEALANNFSAFMQWAITLDVDFQIGLIATEVNEFTEGNDYNGSPDIEPGVLVYTDDSPKIITNSTPNPVAAFAANAKLGTCCSDEQEAGLQAAQMALTPPLIDDPAKNGGFLREDAKLYVIILSDEQDQSRGDPAFYIDFFNSLKGYRNTEMTSVSAICGDSPDGCGEGSETTGADNGSRYIEVADETGGIFQSICTDDWNQALKNLGMDAFTAIREFYLSRLADVSTITVTVNGNSVPKATTPGGANGWTYYTDTNSIFFGTNYIPPKGAKIEVHYTATCLE